MSGQQGRARARELGIKIGQLQPGPLNGITDVQGVRVGHYTRIDGDTAGKEGIGPLNTGLTVVLPHGGDLYRERVPAGFAPLNGSGEVFGREFVDEMGVLDSPIMLTGSFNVARVADAVISETARREPGLGRRDRYVHPFVAECSDAYYSDILARPIGEEEVIQAWRSAMTGPVAEGCVGAGTGLVSYEFKAGIGTASRLSTITGHQYVVGILVSANTGLREQLRVNGVAIGEQLQLPKPTWVQQGSIIIIVATDAPLLQRQLVRLARRTHLGLARTGGTAHNGSGDFALAFSTANRYMLGQSVHELSEVDNESISPLFDAVVEATEEGILNALCAAHDFTGRDGNAAPALPLDLLVDLMRRARL